MHNPWTRRFAAVTLIALAGLLGGCSGGGGDDPNAVLDGSNPTHKAIFIGSNDHSTAGTISLYQSGKRPVLVFENNFRLPDPPSGGTVVALGQNGYRSNAIIGTLLKTNGRQIYMVPDNLRIGSYNEVWLWNPSTGSPVGIARLTKM